MQPDRYTINHRLLIRMQRSGFIFCAICHKPIVEGQRITSLKDLRHEECELLITRKRN